MSPTPLPFSPDPTEAGVPAHRIGLSIAFVVSLILLTTGLLVWQHFGMNVELDLSVASGRNVELNVIDDRAKGGGSVAILTRTANELVLDCDLRATFHLPYCGYQFTLSHGKKGVDLSAYDWISFDLDYRSPGKRMLRFFLHDFERGRSDLKDYMSQKVSEVHFDFPKEGTVEMPVSILRTAPWWIDMRNVPLLHTDVRFDNVTAIDLLIGAQETIGQHQVRLRSIKFHGKLIRQNTLLLILVLVWILSALVWLAKALVQYRAQLRSSRRRLALLSQINNALELETRELADQVYHDPLTGALNREGLRDCLVKKLHSSRQQSQVMAVVFIDLDHFKRVNDIHGHATGDEVLRTFALYTQREIRPNDKLVRWGGEEFLIICLGSGSVDAERLAEKLRAAMERQAWPLGLQITASFGVTTLHPGEDIGDAIKRADGALYEAKASGRNRVVSA